jgi:hypothetical protein
MHVCALGRLVTSERDDFRGRSASSLPDAVSQDFPGQ